MDEADLQDDQRVYHLHVLLHNNPFKLIVILSLTCRYKITVCTQHKVHSELYDMSVYDSEQLSCTPLYDGASLSLMDALVKYLKWFSEHPGISKEALTDILKLEHNEVLPRGNILHHLQMQ